MSGNKMATKVLGTRNSRMVESLEARRLLSSALPVADASWAAPDVNWGAPPGQAPAQICPSGDAPPPEQPTAANVSTGPNQPVAWQPWAAWNSPAQGINPGPDALWSPWPDGVASTHDPRLPEDFGPDHRGPLSPFFGDPTGRHDHPLFDDDDDDDPIIRSQSFKPGQLPPPPDAPPPIGYYAPGPCEDGVESVNRVPASTANVNNASSTETISTGGQNRAAFVLQGSETNGPDSPATTVNGAKFAGATLISDSISPPQSPSSAAAISPFDSGNGVVLSSIHLHSNLFALGNSGDQGNSPPADGEIATAAADVKLIGDVIFVDLSSARQLLKSGMGPASIAVSADFMKTLLLSDATALAQVANAAAARVDVEIKMLRKEFGIFAGLGLVIGIYTLKGRKDLDASVPAKKRRKFLAVGDADSTVFPG